MKTEHRLYDYDLPFTEKDFSPHDPEVTAALSELQRVRTLYKIVEGSARDVGEYRATSFIALAATGQGPDVSYAKKPPLLAYALLLFATECVEDLISLGADIHSDSIKKALLDADSDVLEYFEYIKNKCKLSSKTAN